MPGAGWDGGAGAYEQDKGRALCPEAYIVWCVYPRSCMCLSPSLNEAVEKTELLQDCFCDCFCFLCIFLSSMDNKIAVLGDIKINITPLWTLTGLRTSS